MKKQLFVLAIAMSVSTFVYGQIEIKGLGGINFANLSSVAEGTTIEASTGYQFGGGVLIGDKFYVEPGIQFVRHVRSISSDTDAFNFKLNYLKIPVYAGYHLLGHESGPVALRIFGGPAVAVAGKIKEGEEHITKDDISNANWLLDAGVGVDILFLFVELNYEYAFNDFFTDGGVFGNPDSNHHGFYLNAGIHIDF